MAAKEIIETGQANFSHERRGRLSHGAGGEQNWKSGEEVVHPRAERDNGERGEDPCPAQRAKRFARWREEVIPETSQPERDGCRIHGQSFLTEERRRRQRDVAPAVADVGL
jgi:hypothetical protein